MPSSKVGHSTRVKGPTTNLVRRHESDYDPARAVFTPTAVTPAPPPPPVKPPRPVGELGTASVPEIIAAGQSCLGTKNNGPQLRGGFDLLLGHLARFPGETWQERWEAAGWNERDRPAGEIADNNADRLLLNAAAGRAFAMRLIRPTLFAIRSYQLMNYTTWFRRAADDPLLEDYCERIFARPAWRMTHTNAIYDVCCALTVFGIDLTDLTPEAFLFYAQQCRDHGLTIAAKSGTWAGRTAWPVLHEMGVFPALAPQTLRAAVTRGQQSVTDLVDQHDIRNREIRDLLVDYISRRAVELDYSTLRQLVHGLVKLFWKAVENLNPDQADLRLSEQVVQGWKESLLVRPDGKARLHIDQPFMVVRALYLDIQSWAAAEPERWARWVAPCPVRDTDLRWFHQRRRRNQERIAQRTRDRQPLMPILSASVNDRWHQARDLLKAGAATSYGKTFTHAGVTYRRTASRADLDNGRQGRPTVRAINLATGELIHLSHQENQAFWQWAVIETLRLAGLRAEELVELTHLSVRNYQRPNGEVIALLVISPSKSDRERVIPMSAELFHVVAQVIRRHIAEHGTVPACSRYDPHERTFTEPMPFLFQNRYGSAQRGMSSTTVWRHIRRAVDELRPTHPEFEGVAFAPHDFRRHFATELVNNGLPIHIGAALLGHVNVQTTRGYVAVFDEDVVRHYQEFLDRRRAERPESEYRHPTPQEWTEFENHFDRRRVELGSCGRPYGTGCTHEHACIRCPMLSIDPKMLPRLDELEQDLLARRERAIAENWLGEIDGLNLTLTFLRSKRRQAQRGAVLHRDGPADLGMPAPRADQ